MVLVCGEDGTRRRAIWNTEGLFHRGPSPGREDFNGTGDVHRPARAEPGVPPIRGDSMCNCSTDRGGGRRDLRSPAQKWHKQTRW